MTTVPESRMTLTDHPQGQGSTDAHPNILAFQTQSPRTSHHRKKHQTKPSGTPSTPTTPSPSTAVSIGKLVDTKGLKQTLPSYAEITKLPTETKEDTQKAPKSTHPHTPPDVRPKDPKVDDPNPVYTIPAEDIRYKRPTATTRDQLNLKLPKDPKDNAAPQKSKGVIDSKPTSPTPTELSGPENPQKDSVTPTELSGHKNSQKNSVTTSNLITAEMFQQILQTPAMIQQGIRGNTVLYNPSYKLLVLYCTQLYIQPTH